MTNVNFMVHERGGGGGVGVLWAGPRKGGGDIVIGKLI